MGAELMKQVVVEHADLPERSYKVLMRMAATALDKRNAKGQPVELYFAGWEPLGMALGRDVPTLESAQHDPAAAKERDRVKETVRRAVADLVKRGLVATVGRAHTGSRQTYRLTLRATPAVPLSTVLANPEWGPDTVPQSDESGAPQREPSQNGEGHRSGSERGTATVERGAPQRGKRGTAAVPPRKEEEVEGLIGGEHDSPTVSPSPPARDDTSDESHTTSDPGVRERVIADTRATLRSVDGGRR